MAEFRMLPAKSSVHLNMERGRRNPFLSAHYMADFHQVVVNDVCQMICRKSVAFEQNRIRGNVLVFPCDVAQQVVMESCLSFKRHFETDYIRFSCVEVSLDFLWSEVTAVSVVARSHLVFGLDFFDSLQSLSIAEAVVSLAFVYELLCVFFVKLKSF